MNVLFLDCDGVLNNDKTEDRVGRYLGLDPELLDRFARVVDACRPVAVVVSSTWRLIPDMLAALRHELIARGVTIHDVTPQVGSRGADIGAWMLGQPVERYAIIDDDRDMLPGQVAFHTDFAHGLTEEIADRIIAYMNEGR